MRSFVLGLFVASAGISLVVIADANAQPEKSDLHESWQYKVVHASTFVSVKDLLGNRDVAVSNFEERFNKLGEERWELCEEMDGYLVFKRPK